MKVMSFLLAVVLFSFACTSNVPQEKKANMDKEKAEYTIYLDDFEPLGFTNEDFVKLQEIANKVPERLDTVPKHIAYRLTTQDTNDVEYFCRWIDTEENFPLGAFEIRKNNYVTGFYVSFSKNGDVLDYLVFKRANIEKDNEQIKWKFLSDVTFFFCEDCFPETIEYFAVKTLDTTEEFIHPHLAKVLKTDNWHIDKVGKFKLKKE